MTKLTAAQNQWGQALAAATDTQEQLAAARAPLAERIGAFDAEKPQGLWGKLSHAFNNAVKIYPVRRKVRKIDRRLSENNHRLQDAAFDAYRALGEVAMTQMAGNAEVLGEYGELRQSRRQLAATRDIIANAIDQCSDASGMEMVDIASNNKAISMLSYFETQEARDAINQAQRALAKLEKQLKDFSAEAVDLGDLEFENNLGLMLDMLGGIGGTFMSLSNMQDLDRAADHLSDIDDKLLQVDDKLAQSEQSLLSLGIARARIKDGAVDAFAQAIAPHLPDDIKSSLRAAKRPPSL